MMEECVFCSLAKQRDSHVYEDKDCYAVLDKYPSEYGHMLVISKEHYENVLEAPENIISGMFLVARRLGKNAKKKLNASGLAIATNTGADAGQIIFHFHIHVIPKYSEKRMGFMRHKELTQKEVGELRDKLKS